MGDNNLYNKKNDELCKIMQTWIKVVFEPYYNSKDCEKNRKKQSVDLSCPFYFCIERQIR